MTCDLCGASASGNKSGGDDVEQKGGGGKEKIAVVVYCWPFQASGSLLPPPSWHSAVCIRPLVSHFLLNSSLCADLGFNVHALRCGKPLWNQLCQLAQANKKKQKKLYRQFNWSVRCSEIRADTNTWFHLKDKAQRHLVLIIVINPVTQSWKSSSVCLYKYDYCKCNLKHCARIWMRPWFWYDRGRSWLRTGHDPGQDRRLSPEPLKVTKS